jgi:ADP-ribose pyrophosphatase YjhB (NUDIX family)
MKYCPRCATLLEDRVLESRTRRACPSDGCGFIFYDNPTPVVAAIVEHDGEVVLVQNKGWPATWFGLVTGFLERDETPEDGALRELREELALDGDAPTLVGVYPFLERNELIVAYHVRARGEIRLGDELAAFKRVPIDKLRPWPFGTGHAVRDWLARRT